MSDRKPMDMPYGDDYIRHDRRFDTSAKDENISQKTQFDDKNVPRNMLDFEKEAKKMRERVFGL